MKIKVIAFFVASVLSNFAFSDAVWHASEIHSIYPLSDGSFVITFKSDSESCPNGVSPNKYHYVRAGKNGVSSDGVERMLSVALSAASMGKEVTINYDDSSKKCFVNRLRLFF